MSTSIYDPLSPLLNTGAPELKLRHGWADRPAKLTPQLEQTRNLTGSLTADALLRLGSQFLVPRAALNNRMPSPAWKPQSPNVSPWHAQMETASPPGDPSGIMAILASLQRQNIAGMLPQTPISPYL